MPTYAHVEVDELLRRTAARLDGLGGDWHESDYPLELLGREPATSGHLAWAIDAPDTDNTKELRDKPSVGSSAETKLLVRFLYQLAATDTGPGLRAAVAAEAEVLKRMVAQDADWPIDLHFRWESRNRALDATGTWRICTLTFTVSHLIALQ